MNKTIQITAGRGPAECTWVVAQVLKFFLIEARENCITTTVLRREKGMENGTVQSVVVLCSGEKLDVFFSTWVGTIQWIGQSTFRKFHKRKNWFIGLSLLTTNDPLTMEENEVEYQTMRSSGPGGQNANKVSSAVRATHVPTGIIAVSSDSRSQLQNKKLALSRLKEKVQNANIKKLENGEKEVWSNHLDVERGNPIRVFKGSDFKQKTNKKSAKTSRSSNKNALKKEIENETSR